MSLRRVYYALPPKLRLWVRKLTYGPLDLFRSEKYENGLPVPSRSLIYTGSGDFKETGLRFVEYFKRYGLEAGHDVLDIGSGIGRIALPLTSFLKGDYHGLDIMPQGVNWCQRNITPLFPHFKFTQVSVKNDLYTNKGTDAAELSFPVEDGQFDFTCLISVFTHMVPHEVEHYMEEIHRCLRPGAICFATFFIYERKIDLKENNFQEFIEQDERHALMDEKVQSANVAYAEGYLMPMLRSRGFDVIDFSRGKWLDAKAKDDFQDFVVLKKK